MFTGSGKPKPKKAKDQQNSDSAKSSNLNVRNDPLEAEENETSAARHKTTEKKTKKFSGDEIRIVTQPTVIYDLLPVDKKNPSFLLRFDLVHPRSRLVIVHRTVKYKFSDLDVDDRRALISLGLDFGRKYSLSDVSLRIPVSKNSEKSSNEKLPFFHAYLVLPYVDEFLKLFRHSVKDVPLWPGKVWYTDLWPSFNKGESMSDCYERGVRSYHKEAVDSEVKFRRTRRSATGADSNSKLQTTTFTMVEHSNLPVVGFSPKSTNSNTDKKGMSKVNQLLALMDFMYSNLERSTKKPCHMCISLANGYASGNGWRTSVHGYLDFFVTNKVPSALINQLTLPSEASRRSKFPRRSKTEDEIKSVVSNSSGNISSDNSEKRNMLLKPKEKRPSKPSLSMSDAAQALLKNGRSAAADVSNPQSESKPKPSMTFSNAAQTLLNNRRSAGADVSNPQSESKPKPSMTFSNAAQTFLKNRRSAAADVSKMPSESKLQINERNTNGHWPEAKENLQVETKKEGSSPKLFDMVSKVQNLRQSNK